MSKSTLTPRGRAALLVADVREHGWTLEFVEGSTDGVVQFVGPDADQPSFTSPADWLMARRFLVVCGLVLSLHPLDGTIGEFDDTRLCRRCWAAFATPDDQALIFEHNSTDWQEGAASRNHGIRVGHQIRGAA